MILFNFAHMKKTIPILVAVIISLTSCLKENKQPEIDDKIIQKYLADHNLTASATRDAYGLYYIKTLEGTGGSPDISKTVEVKYKGMLVDGTVFDQSEQDKTFTYELSGLILGWQIGIPYMKKGGKAILVIPSSLGYGNTSIGPIPANSVLVFEIELVDFR